MKNFGIDVKIKNIPPLDENFVPLNKFCEEFLKTAKNPFSIAVERSNEQVAVYNTFIHGSDEMFDADVYYIDRIVKMFLWMKGGFKVYICGDKRVYSEISSRYSLNGKHTFDSEFMSRIYSRPFEVVYTDKMPQEKSLGKAIGRHMDGCRIGFDAGGSDRKVSAVINGESVFSREVVWHPKINSDPNYHYDGIVSSMKEAAQHLPRVDAIGVSSAGIYIDNKTKAASLFLKVSNEDFKSKVEDIYIRAASEFGDVPVVVCNDGDVTALAGAISIGDNNVLGIAMGTSEAVGYVDKDGNITGWLNELAFAPVDVNQGALIDEWSNDIGVGCKYFSQDAVIKLAPLANINLDESLSPAQKLKFVQELMESDHKGAALVFESIGVYLGHALAMYYDFYNYKNVLLLGRVMSKKGGDIIYSTCKNVLKQEYTSIYNSINICLPDEKFRRVGQSAAAASLPQIK